MLTAGIAVLSGTLLACFLPHNIDTFWVSLLPACLYFAYINPRWRAFWIVVGSFLWATAHVNGQLDQRLAAELNNKRLTVVGEVVNIPQVSQVSTRFLLKPEKIQNYHGKLPGLIKLSWRNAAENIVPGNIWQLKLKLKQPHGYQNPGGFDYERWLFVKGIHATGYVITSNDNHLIDSGTVSLNSFRAKINDAIQTICRDCLNTGLIQALATGYRGNINPSHRKVLQQTGTAHLIAISGLHIGIIAGVFYAAGLMLWKLIFYQSRINRKEFALLLSWLAGLSYSLVAGFDLPAQRAFLMLSVIFVSVWVRVSFNLLNSIMTALVLVLIASPLSVLSESLWLTFTALFIILLGSLVLRKQNSKIQQLVLIQFLFSLLFIPISIVIFGQIHVASLVANLVAVPLISFIIVPANFTLLSLLWLPDDWIRFLYTLVDGLLGLLMDYLQWLQDAGLEALVIPDLSGWRLLLILIFLLMWVLPAGILPKRPWSLLLAVMIFWPREPLSGDDLQLTVLDVGMGTSIVVETRFHSLIYDFGPGNDKGYSLGKWVLIPYLRHQGVAFVDRLIFSHSDQDHLGGYYAIRQDLLHGTVLSGTPDKVKARLPKIKNVLDCHQQQDWMWDGVTFEFISSGSNKSDRENNRSCVLKITTAKQSILITGDIEADQELKLVRLHADKLKAGILIAPHHGSLTSSSSAFIQAVNARDVIFTSGYLNRWGFPRPTVVSRYLNTAARIYRTASDGAIRIRCSKNNCELNRYRQHRPRLWY